MVNAHKVTLAQQEATNNVVLEFNCEVFKVKKERDLFSPSLHRTIHRSKNGSRKSFYEHLEDGVHLQVYMKDKWAQEFVKAADNN